MEEVEAILERASGTVVTDEAYAPFTEFTWMPRLGPQENQAFLEVLSGRLG